MRSWPNLPFFAISLRMANQQKGENVNQSMSHSSKPAELTPERIVTSSLPLPTCPPSQKARRFGHSAISMHLLPFLQLREPQLPEVVGIIRRLHLICVLQSSCRSTLVCSEWFAGEFSAGQSMHSANEQSEKFQGPLPINCVSANEHCKGIVPLNSDISSIGIAIRKIGCTVCMGKYARRAKRIHPCCPSARVLFHRSGI